VAEIKERATLGNVALYSLSVSDRFSGLGLVGVLEVDGDILTLFSLSCRALGREIERKLLNFVASKHKVTKIDFKSTGKNEDVKTLFMKAFPTADISI
jgi:predicted enzyme involved in methoxymalonyl-ACP biosynthesis